MFDHLSGLAVISPQTLGIQCKRDKGGLLPVKRGQRRRIGPSQNGPGLLFILVAIGAVALVSARFFGFTPGDWLASTGGPVDVTTGEAWESGVPASQQPGDEAPLVLIYHTHASENYVPNQPHAKSGQAGDVVEVGRTFAAALEAEGIRTVHITGAYDSSWSDSYDQVRPAVAQILNSYGAVAAVFDLHRDSIENWHPSIATAQIDGADVAKILFVVGEKGNTRVQENIAFATQIKEQLGAQQPQLSRGVRTMQGDFNGDLHPNAVQVYVGEHRDNSLAEAKLAAQHLAKAVAKVLLTD